MEQLQRSIETLRPCTPVSLPCIESRMRSGTALTHSIDNFYSMTPLKQSMGSLDLSSIESITPFKDSGNFPIVSQKNRSTS